jgi:hypothetical protein
MHQAGKVGAPFSPLTAATRTCCLPPHPGALLQAHAVAEAAAETAFREQLLGRRQAGSLREQLTAAVAKEHHAKETANIAESNTVCQAHEMECTKQLANKVQVPSLYQFEHAHKACMKRFEVRLPDRAGGLTANRPGT